MTMITPSYLGETIEYSSLHACRSTLEDPTRFQHTYMDTDQVAHDWLLSTGVSGVNYYFPSTTIRFPEGCS